MSEKINHTLINFAEVFHLAADEYLDYRDYSCHAIVDALFNLAHEKSVIYEDEDFIGFLIESTLEELGLNINCTDQFNEFPEGEVRQSVRYAWLKFCALLVEEGVI